MTFLAWWFILSIVVGVIALAVQIRQGLLMWFYIRACRRDGMRYSEINKELRERGWL